MMNDITQNMNPSQILVVDDSPDSLKLITKILADQGYQVRPASDAKLALRSVAAEAPDIILLDVKMPDMDGYEVCRRLKSDEKIRSIPVIFISALDEVIDKVKGFQAGGVDYITKPFEAAEVLARVGTHLGLRRLQEHMEELVRQRTAELSKANTSLQAEITERTRAEKELHKVNRMLKMLSDCNQKVVRAKDETSLLHDVCKIIVETGSYEMAWVGFAEDDEGKTVRPVAHAGSEKDYLKAAKVTWGETEHGSGPTGTAIRTGAPAVCKDISKDQTLGAWRIEAVARQYQSAIAIPLTTDGHVLGALSIFTNKAGDFDPDEVNLLTELAGDVAYGIMVLRTQNEHNKMEVALRESEARYKLITENMTDTVWLMDMNLKLTWISPSVVRTRGFTSEELCALPFEKHLAPGSLAKALKIYAEALTPETIRQKDLAISRQIELELTKKDGSTFWSDIWVTVLRDPQGNPVGLLGVGRDITKRKQAEDKLKESENRYRTIFENTGTGMIIIEEDTTISLVNAEFAKLTGYTQEEIEGKKSWTDFVVKDDREMMLARHRLRRVDKDAAEKQYEFRLVDAQGNTKNVFLAIEMIPGTKKSVASFLDITERKRAEEALLESEEQHRTILQTAMDGFALTDIHGHLMEVNKAYCRMIGYSEEELLTMSIFDMEIAETEPETEAHLQKVMTRGYDRFETQHRRNDGSIIDVEVSVQYKPLKGGQFVVFLRDITERKQAEESLRRSEEKYRLTFSSTSDVIYTIDPDFRISSMTPNVEKFLGYKAEEVINRPFPELNFLTSESLEKAFSDVTRVLSGEQVSASVYEFIAKDGTRIFAEISGSPLIHEDKIIGITAVARDITKRKLAEEALRDSEEFLSSIIENIPNMIFVKDAETLRFVKFNTEGEKLLGQNRQDLIGKNDYDLFPKSQADFFTERDREVLKNKQLVDIPEEPIQTRHLGERILHTKKIPIIDREGNARYLLGISEDITDLKQAENLYRTLADSSHAGVFIAQDGIFQFVNPHIQEYSGYSEAEIVGSHSLTYVHPDDREITRLHAIEMLKGKRRIPYEYRIISRNGDTKLLIETVRSITYGGKKAVLGNTMDITERYQMEGLLRQAQKMESIGTLAGGIAHDFNNILGAILGYTEMALANQRMDDRQRHYLEQVFRAAERARDLVKQILTFSRQKEQEKKPVLIAPIIKEGIKLLRSSLPATIKITQSIKDTSLMVLADPTQIHQVVMNLCTNASHAMRERGGVLDIQLVRERIEHFGTPHPLNLAAGDYAKVTVSDTGHGIDATIMDRIFDPFFTTKGPGEGTGLGLSVVYGIVSDHGGSIGVSSELGRGTTITVYFPLIETEEPIKELVPETIPGGSERILFIDDEATLAELGSMLLTSLGYDVTTRTSSIEALEAFRAGPYGFDLVITDMTMPNMRGDDLARELLKIRPDIPIILCTGFSEMISEEKAKNLGIRHLIMKPVSKKDLAQAIHYVLDTQ